MSTQLSSRKLDTSGSRKKSLCTGGTGKKFTKKGKTHKQKSAAAAVSVTEEVNDLHNVEDTSTATAHSFVSEQQKGLKATSKSAEQKRAVIERKRLEKKQLEEERLLKEKENLRLQELLEKQRQEHLQQQEKTDTNNNIDDNDMLSKIKCPYVTPGQVSGLAALERQRVLEERLELSVVDEALKAKADQRDHEVDELLQRAKEAEATFVAELKEHERLQRLKKVSEVTQPTCHSYVLIAYFIIHQQIVSHILFVSIGRRRKTTYCHGSKET